jgi:ABC-type tungstate transport system permease subunit
LWREILPCCAIFFPRKCGKLTLFTSAIVLIQIGFCLAGEYKQIVLATGSPFELGLVQAIAKPFEKETGYTVRVIKTPTEPGLDLGKNGLAHITGMPGMNSIRF